MSDRFQSVSRANGNEYTGTDQELRYIKLDFFQASLFYLHKTDQDRTHTDIQNSEFLKASRTFALNSISYPFALQSTFLSFMSNDSLAKQNIYIFIYELIAGPL